MSSRSCPVCGEPVPADHRFCGKCGNRMDGGGGPAAADPPGMPGAPAAGPGAAGGGAKTMFFGAIQMPGRAKLILIKGEGMDGVSYQLNGTEHVAGRSDGAILFPEDPLLSPRHANFVYRDSKLHVQDEGSVNGIFVRIRSPMPLDSGGLFLVGEQLLQIDASAPDLGPQPDAEGTYFYASPKRPSKMKMVQRLRGGEIGMIFRARNDVITIGREGNDVNFPDDPFISGRHAQVNMSADGRFTLVDTGSKNGTFLRITDEAPLNHGDYVFLGQQLLRVEIT